MSPARFRRNLDLRDARPQPDEKWGGRWDLNPRPLEPQSSALPLSYAHHCKTSPGNVPGSNIFRRAIARLSSSPGNPVARLAGLEPATLGLEGRCSIRLSYRRKSGSSSSAADPPAQSNRSKPFRPAAELARPASANPNPASTHRFERCDGARRSWSGWQDSNLRPTAPKAVALPGCATPRLAV